jgi:hypothetical protein
MKRALSITVLSAMTMIAALGVTTSSRAEFGAVKEAKGEEFDKRLFGNPIGKDKAWACFVRRYAMNRRNLLSTVAASIGAAFAATPSPGSTAAQDACRPN